MDDTTWTALVDPRRRAVLDLLRQVDLSVGELVDRLGLTQPQTSKHLRVLRDAGLVQVVQRAQQRIYAIDPAPMAELDAWLAPYRHLWNTSLEQLALTVAGTPGEVEAEDLTDFLPVLERYKAQGLPDDGWLPETPE